MQNMKFPWIKWVNERAYASPRVWSVGCVASKWNWKGFVVSIETIKKNNKFIWVNHNDCTPYAFPNHYNASNSWSNCNDHWKFILDEICMPNMRRGICRHNEFKLPEINYFIQSLDGMIWAPDHTTMCRVLYNYDPKINAILFASNMKFHIHIRAQ